MVFGVQRMLQANRLIDPRPFYLESVTLKRKQRELDIDLDILDEQYI
jgi:hypothetical protein